MKLLNLILTVLVITLLSSTSWSTSYDELVQRDGLYYKKFTDVPFTGNVTGKTHGYLNNGIKEGAWVFHWSNGTLKEKGNYENGRREGVWLSYSYTGGLFSKGNYLNDMR